MAFSTERAGSNRETRDLAVARNVVGPHNSVASPRRQTPRVWKKKFAVGVRSGGRTLAVGEMGLANSVRPLKISITFLSISKRTARSGE